jgi:pimeloyl-ACP methyl ester carboxylesterase
VVGHSWGSGLAFELYRRHPAVPSSLVLVGGYAGWAGSLPADEVDRRLRFALELADVPAGAIEPESMPACSPRSCRWTPLPSSRASCETVGPSGRG